MKFREGPIAICGLIALALWLFVALPLYYRPRNSEATYAQQHTEQKGGSNGAETHSLWVPTDSVGLYTLVLAVFTGLLAIVSFFQGWMLLRSDRTARISAEAARHSATAAVAGLLPVVRVDGIQASDWADLAAENDQPAAIGILLKTEVVNNGNGVAFITAIQTGAFLGPALPSDYRPTRVWTVKEGLFIGANGTLIVDESRPIALNAANYDRMLRKEARFWYVGAIRFRDFLGDETELGFVWRYVPGKDRSGKFEEAHSPDHTYYKKFKGTT